MTFLTSLPKRELLSIMLVSLGTLNVGAEPAQTSSYGETEATWPGVKFQITQMVRTDATHVLAAVRIIVGPSAPDNTFIGDPPKAGFRLQSSNSTLLGMDSPEHKPTPFSLATAKLIDETTRQEFKASPNVPMNPYFGGSSMLTTASRNTWSQLGVLFNVPPPQPAGADGKYPPQLATILLPKAKKAIEHVVLPLPTPASAVSPAASPATVR